MGNSDIVELIPMFEGEGAFDAPPKFLATHPRPPNLERRGLEHGYQIELLQSTDLPIERKKELHELATELFSPNLIPPPVDQWSNPKYSLGRVMPKDYSSEPGSRSNTALVFVPGIGLDAAGVIPAAAKLQEAYEKHYGTTKQAITFALDAPVHTGDFRDILKTSTLQRSAYQAQMLFEQIREHNINTVAFFTHSLGATEVLETTLILRELLKKHNLDTSIEGVVFAQAPGFYKKADSMLSGVKTYAGEFLDSTTLRHGIRNLFPSPEDVFEMKRRQQAALEGEKMDDARFYGKIIDALNDRRGKIGLPAVATPVGVAEQQVETSAADKQYIIPKYKNAVLRIPDKSIDQVPALDEGTFRALVEIDNGLELAHTAQQKQTLLKQRESLLKPIAKQWRQDKMWYSGEPADTKEKDTGELHFSNIPPLLDRLVNGIPEFIREKVDIPVGYAHSMAPEDTYFRAEEAHDKIELEHLKRMEQLHNEQQREMQQLEKGQKKGNLLEDEVTRMTQLQHEMTPAYRKASTELFPHAPRVVAATWADLPHASATYQFESLGERCIDMLDRLRSVNKEEKYVQVRDVK